MARHYYAGVASKGTPATALLSKRKVPFTLHEYVPDPNAPSYGEGAARAIGVQITQRVAGLEMGSQHGFAGFIASQRNGRGVVFHVTELD